MRREWLVSFFLVAAVTAVYWPVHSYPFVILDDPSYVVDNPYVRKGLAHEGLVHAFTVIVVGNWHPITMLSHMLDCQLFGADPAAAGWHHLVNLLLHAANTVLLFIALRRMTGAVWRSALVAALFGLHPLHVESVAWVAERKDLLCGLFFMLILLAYQHYVRRPTIFRYAAVFALLALGLMSKPMMVTAPLVLLLLDYWPLGRMKLRPPAPAKTAEEPTDETTDEDDTQDAAEEDESAETAGPHPPGEAEETDEPAETGEIMAIPFPLGCHHPEETDESNDDDNATAEAEQPPADESGKQSLGRLIVEKIPLLVLVAVSSVLTYAVQQMGGAMGMLGEQLPFWTRLGNAIYSYGQYLVKSFWPSPLAAIYLYANRHLIDVLIFGLALVAISAAAFFLVRVRPFLFVGWCWFVGMLVPVIGLVQVGVQSMADRYTYLPLIGIFIIAAWGAAEFAQDWPARNKAVAVAVVLTLFGWLTWRQVAFWSSSEALYRHAVEAEPYNYYAQYLLGMTYWQDGKLDQAQEQFEAILNMESDPQLRAEGGFEPAHRALGLLLAVRQYPRNALKQFDAAILARPRQPQPRRHKAWLLATSLNDNVRNGSEAVKAAEQALQDALGQPPEYWDTLAAAQAEAGDFRAAVASEAKALQQARSPRDDDLLPGIQGRLKLFQSGKPYHAEACYPLRP